MMRIDMHTHIWNNQFDRVTEFVESLDRFEIDRAAVLGIAPYMDNEDVARCVKQAPDRLVGFAGLHPFAETTGIPRRDPVDELRRAVEGLGLRGLKLHPIIQGFKMNDPGLLPVVQAAGELGVPVLFHTGPSRGRVGRIANAEISLLDDLAIMCPDTVLIAGHADPWGVAPEIAAKHPNVYLETSISWPRYCSLIPGLAAQAIDIAGADHVLFGTDFSLGKDDRVREVDEVLTAASVSPESLAKVYAGNAAKLLDLSEG